MVVTLDPGGVPSSDDGGGRPNRDHPNNISDMFPSNFPEGLRVLVFDEDPAYLLILERHLQEFQYQVTTCNEESEAISLLRNHKNRFHIAMIQANSSINSSNGDRIRYISEIGSEMDLAIIMISKDDSIQSVVKWMSTGAIDYLIKPIRPEDLRIIFKHVVKKMLGRRPLVTVEAEEKAAGEKSSSVGDSTIRNPNKRTSSSSPNAEVNEEDHNDDDRVCASSSKKKRRVVWDGELHKKFLDAVNCLGHNKAVPKKILEIMNVENISRENVASHLQKFRMGMKKGNEKIKNEETTNLALITPQEGIMYVGADASQYFREKNFQLPTHHVNNIPQPTYVPQHTTNPNNLMTHLISPLEHHYDEAFVAVSGRGLVMNHQYHNHHQTSDFTVEETFGYKNFQEEEEPTVASLMLTPNPKHVELYPCQPEYNSMEIRNNHEVGTSSSMLHLPQLISSPRTYSLEQHESGGFSYNSDITGSINYSKSA